MISNAKEKKSQVITVTALSDLATQTLSYSPVLTVTPLSTALSSPSIPLALSTKLSSRSSPAGRDITWNHRKKSGSQPLIQISRKFRHLRDRSLSPRSGVQAWLLPVIPYLPL
ncbi:hypothetical protein AVEN_14182-1 [Araneus ventricosus]|uniref:Uncharacterized protein n=1 Tax=Araneus ventricosus TaxID=182803 RepID=A0A4Y2KEJ6_ARAVE|nr:hypothetical protein AVEN_14182-1 [Araneus ventricosus]